MALTAKSAVRCFSLLLAVTIAEAGTAEGLEALKVEDYSKAKREFLAGAEVGDAEAQFQLGELFWKGLGVARTPRFAAQWYEKAAAQEHANAKGMFGVLLWRGKGVREDRERAVELLRAAAADGSVIAQYELAMLLYRGEKIGIPSKSSYEYFRKAAVQGHAGAQAQYGSALMHGRIGGKEDPVAAEEWLRKAAMQDHPRAMRDLARCLEKQRKRKEALDWHKKAALWGEFSGQMVVATKSLRTDPVEAYAWYIVHSDLRNSMPAEGPSELIRKKSAAKTKSWLKLLRKRLDAKEIRQGKSRAKQYIKVIRENMKKRSRD